jgi:hypothetical protein
MKFVAIFVAAAARSFYRGAWSTEKKISRFRSFRLRYTQIAIRRRASCAERERE